MTVSDMIATLRARWLTIAATLAVVLALAVAAIMLMPKRYTATASLLFNDAQTDPGAVTPAAAEARQASLSTQADIIRSAAVTQIVIERLHLDREPAFRDAWEEQTRGRSPFGPWLVQLLQSMISVEPVLNDNVLAISVKTTDPGFAAAIANAYARAFVDKQLALRTGPARSYADWFEERSRALRQQLEAAQARMTAYRQKHGLTGADRLDIETNRLNELSNQLAAAQAQAADAVSRSGKGSAGSVEVLSSGVVQGLRAQIAAKTGQLHQLEATLGPNHPQVQTANAELVALRGQLASETGKAAGSLSVASQSAQAREVSLQGLVAQQRQRVLAMSGDQDQLAILQRDVDLARAAFETASQHTGSVTLESQLQQTNATLLDSAEPPTAPSSPKVMIILFLATVFGLMLGPTIAIGIEMLGPRARTRQAVERASGQPVLAELPWLRPARALMAR